MNKNASFWSKNDDEILIDAFNSGGNSASILYSLSVHKFRGKFTIGDCLRRFNILKDKGWSKRDDEKLWSLRSMVGVRNSDVSRILRRPISSLEARLKTLDSEKIPPTLFTVLEKSTNNGKNIYFVKEGQRKDLKKSDLRTVVLDRDGDCSYGVTSTFFVKEGQRKDLKKSDPPTVVLDRDGHCSYGGERSRNGGGGSRRYGLIEAMEEVGRFVKQWNKDGFKKKNRAMEEDESLGAERSCDGGGSSRLYDLIGSREEVASFVELWIKDGFKEQRNRAMEEEESLGTEHSHDGGGGSRLYDLIGSREEVASFVELWIKDGFKE